MSRSVPLKSAAGPLISKSDSGRGRNGHDRPDWVPLPHLDSHSGTENARSPPDRAFAYHRTPGHPPGRAFAFSGEPPPALRSGAPLPLRIASWNINSLRLRLDNVTRLVETLSPDVLCLQEIKVQDE